MIKCPQCGNLKSDVKDSRLRGETVKRLRECRKCGHKYRTSEEYDLNLLVKPYIEKLITGQESNY